MSLRKLFGSRSDACGEKPSRVEVWGGPLQKLKQRSSVGAPPFVKRYFAVYDGKFGYFGAQSDAAARWETRLQDISDVTLVSSSEKGGKGRGGGRRDAFVVKAASRSLFLKAESPDLARSWVGQLLEQVESWRRRIERKQRSVPGAASPDAMGRRLGASSGALRGRVSSLSTDGGTGRAGATSGSPFGAGETKARDEPESYASYDSRTTRTSRTSGPSEGKRDSYVSAALSFESGTPRFDDPADLASLAHHGSFAPAHPGLAAPGAATHDGRPPKTLGAKHQLMATPATALSTSLGSTSSLEQEGRPRRRSGRARSRSRPTRAFHEPESLPGSL